VIATKQKLCVIKPENLPKTKTRSDAGFYLLKSNYRLSNVQVTCSNFACAFVSQKFVRNFLAFIEVVEASALHSTNMNENIISTSIWLNEAEAFLCVKPLNCSSKHRFIPCLVPKIRQLLRKY
jgi:hypothetical protein